MKPLTVLFVGLLIWSQHVAGEALGRQPLSMFRDGDYSLVGYALFALLFAIGVLMTQRLQRIGCVAEARVFAVATGILMLTAATPSLNPWHEAAAILLMLALFGYYMVQLLLARSSWLYVHLVAPLAMTAPFWGEYGPWQKAMILYLVLILNIHWHLLKRKPAHGANGAMSGQLRRRVVYRVEDGKSWPRRDDLAHGTSYV